MTVNLTVPFIHLKWPSVDRLCDAFAMARTLDGVRAGAAVGWQRGAWRGHVGLHYPRRLRHLL